MQLDLYSRAGRRQEFQPEFFRNLHPARDVLRWLLHQRDHLRICLARGTGLSFHSAVPIPVMCTFFRILWSQSYSVFAGLILMPFASSLSAQTEPANTNAAPAPLNWTTEQDHRNMMEQLGITRLRPGRNGNANATNNLANYDQAKANPYPDWPDALTLKERAKGHDSRNVVEAASPGNCGGFRARSRRTRAQRCSQSDVDRHHPGDGSRRRQTSRRREAIGWARG